LISRRSSVTITRIGVRTLYRVTHVSITEFNIRVKFHSVSFRRNPRSLQRRILEVGCHFLVETGDACLHETYVFGRNRGLPNATGGCEYSLGDHGELSVHNVSKRELVATLSVAR
jgi:hypothetical protein